MRWEHQKVSRNTQYGGNFRRQSERGAERDVHRMPNNVLDPCSLLRDSACAGRDWLNASIAPTVSRTVASDAATTPSAILSERLDIANVFR